MDKLIESLTYIKEYCKESICKECPMSCGGECLVANDSPYNWEIVEPIQKVMV